MSANTAVGQAGGVRYHGLDALRAWAMSMGIVLHAAWILIPSDSGAPAMDVSANAWCDWLCLAIHTFRMQLFFVLAGFFACLLIEKRGVWKFATNRLSRIVVPLVLFWMLLIPICTWQYNAAGLRSGAIQSESTAWGLTVEFLTAMTPTSTMLLHLWFLYYLAWAYLVVVSFRYLVAYVDRGRTVRNRIHAGFRAMIVRPWSVLVLAVAAAPMIWLMKGTWGIEIGFDTLAPAWPGLLSYSLYFAVGWLLFRNVDQLETVVRHWRWQLALGLLLTVPYYFYSHTANETGYSTWKYPLLAIEDLQFDPTTNQHRYAELREALLHADEDTVARAVWDALPELNQTFVKETKTVSANQLAGLMNAMNLHVLSDQQFSAQFSFTDLSLSDEAKRLSQLAPELLEPEQSQRLNRAIVEVGFGGLVHGEDIHRPYYGSIRAAYAFGYSCITWCLIFGCIGCFHTCFASESRFWRYFSDSSYWMYLAHLPVQFQILLWLGEVQWSGAVKFLVYVVGTCAILVPSYHFLVRPTWIGWLLSGRRYSIRSAKETAPSKTDASSRTPEPSFTTSS